MRKRRPAGEKLAEAGAHREQQEDAAEPDAGHVGECLPEAEVGPLTSVFRGIETRDLVAYRTLHTDVIGTLPQVASITNCVVMETAKDERG